MDAQRRAFSVASSNEIIDLAPIMLSASLQILTFVVVIIKNPLTFIHSEWVLDAFCWVLE